MQQSDVLYQCESQALSQGLDQNQSPAQPQDRANEPAAEDATAGAAKKGSTKGAAKGIAAGVSTGSTAAGKLGAAEKGSEPVAEEPKKSWFVMRDLKRANAKMPAYKFLMEKEIEVFTPMHTVLKVVKGRQQKVQEPFVRDLLFVHDTRAAIDPIVEVTPTLQYRYERGKGYKVPMVVRDAEMNRFILAVTASKSTKYYTPGELSPKMIGRNVRITGGPLEGYAGKLLKISGSRTKRLLVQLEGILSAGVEVDAQYIELL
jgi:transcription antitermination factor NusG